MEIQSSSHLDIVRRRRKPEKGKRETYNIITRIGGGEVSHGDESTDSAPPPSLS